MEAPFALSGTDNWFFAAPETRLVVSTVSIWEMRLKYNARHPSGSRKNRFDQSNAVAALEEQDVTFLPMTTLHAARALKTPRDHKKTRSTNCCSSRLRKRGSNR